MAVDLATALMSVYECLTEPDRYFEMTEILVAWLDEDQTTAQIEAFEKHSETVWAAMTASLLTGSDSKTKPAERPNTPSAELIGHESLLGILCAEDAARLQEWQTNSQESPLLVRDYSQGISPQIAYVSSVGAGQLGITRADKPFEDLVAKLFRDQFGFTPREVDVLRGLVAGQSLDEISRTHERSIETIRSQVKSIAGRLGARGQADIVRLAGQAALLDPVTTPQPQDQAPEVQASKRLLLADGRTIEYDIAPSTDGFPLVFFHCVTGGRHWSQAAIEHAKEAGYRTIRISRAGFGGSTTCPLTADALLAAHAQDTAAVLDAEGINYCVVLAHGLGFAPAYRFALAFPERVAGVVGLDIPPPVLKRSDAEGLRGTYKAGAMANLYAPMSARLIAGFALRYLAKRGGPDPTAPLALPGIDLTKYEAPDGLAAYERNFMDARASKGEAYWREASYSTVDWASAPTNANHQPVCRLLQSSDSVLVVPGTIAGFAERIGAPVRPIATFLPLIAAALPAAFEEIAQIMPARVSSRST
jgi:pimeloyl-ACP methyl ester carboxylesterase/DNA-binding CsgD family transcriptional regulator